MRTSVIAQVGSTAFPTTLLATPTPLSNLPLLQGLAHALAPP